MVETVGPCSGTLAVGIKGDPNSPNIDSRGDGVVATISPAACLIRNFPTDLTPQGHVHTLVGLCMSRIPAVNDLRSIYMGMNRAMVYAELASIGRDPDRGLGLVAPLPVVPLRYVANNKDVEASSLVRSLRDMVGSVGAEESGAIGATLEAPLVAKVGSTHAGFGKMFCRDEQALADLRSILLPQSEFYTLEPFVEHAYEYRIQYIDGHVRTFRRTSDTSWKNNTGNVAFTPIPVTKEDEQWAQAVADHMWGSGMVLFALDVLVIPTSPLGEDDDPFPPQDSENVTKVILEINDTANGLMYDHAFEDNRRIRNAVYNTLATHLDRVSAHCM